MKSAFKPILLLACLFLVARSGHIYPEDISISPNNKNTPSVITFIFTPETSLATSDYLRIILPFKLNANTAAVWNIYTNCAAVGTDMAATFSASTLASDTNAYFVQFYTDSSATTLAPVTGNLTYYLKITGTPDSSAQTGINNPVQLYTVSNNVGNWIVYDSNPVFGTLTLNDPFPSTMTVAIKVPTTVTNSKGLGNTYQVNIDLTPSITLKNRGRIDIILTNPAFTLSSCSSVSSTSEKIASLAASFQTLNSYSTRATITQTVTAGNSAKYRFQCSVTNPPLPATTRISVQNRMGYVETITEAGTDTVGLQAATTSSSSSISGWSEGNHKILLGWGYEASSPTALGIFGIYKDATTTESWYQSVKTIFQPATDLANTQVLQVVVSTVNDPGFNVLAASIYHNLPSYPGSTVSCNAQTQGYLICQNVGVLHAQPYFISFRFSLISTATVSTVSDFGKVSVQTQAVTPAVVIALSQTTLTNKAIKTNIALFTGGTNGVIASSTIISGSLAKPYVANTQDIILKFGFKYFSSNIVPLSTAQNNRGIEFYTSQALAAATTPTCTIGTLATGTDVTITDCAVDQLTTFTRLRFRLAAFLTTSGAVGTLFQSTPQSGTISFNKVNFGSSFSSLNYMSETSFDYYARWVQGFTASNPTIVQVTSSSSFFFNSLVYQAEALANVQVGTTFFVTGATSSDTPNLGTSFPTLIRVSGTLLSAESNNAVRLLLFFNDLIPLDTVNPCFGLTTVTCTYNVNGLDNTATDSLTDYAGSRYIAINTVLTNTLNIYIPVQTIAEKTSIGFFLATAREVNAVATGQSIFNAQHSKRFSQTTSTATSLTITAAAASGTPKLVPPASTAMGAVVDSTMSVPTGYAPPASNTLPTTGGAAYGYCANYDFTAGSGFAFQSFSSTPYNCVKMTYPVSSASVTCAVCPVDTPMTAPGSLTLPKFTMPTLTGADIYNNVYVVGKNNGDFYKAAYDSQAAVLTPKVLSSTSLTFSPLSLKKQAVNTLASFSFTTVATLPQAILIDLLPVSPATLYMDPVTGFTCTSNTVALSSCTVSGTTTDLKITAITSGANWPIGTQNVNFLVNANSAAASLSADTTITYQATIKVTGTTAYASVHHTSPSATYKVMNSASSDILLSDATYYFGNMNARTFITFNFELPSDVTIYAGQTIVFDLGGIAAANVGQKPNCLVYNYATSSISNDFSSCDVSDLTELTLSPKVSASGIYTLVIDFLYVPSSAGPTGISATVYAIDGATIVTQSSAATPLALPTATTAVVTPSTNVVLTRLYSNPGNVAEVVLNIKPSVKAIGQTSYMYMYFPTYYSDNLGYENIWCTAADLPVSCFVTGPRLIMLTSFPIDIAVGTNVQIKIYGVITPVVPTPVGKIFIGIDDDQDMFTLVEQIEVNDLASNSGIPITLYVDSYALTTYKIRETADHTLSFTTDAIGIRANKIIAFDFPDRYGGILGGQTGPVINIQKTGDATITSVQSTSFGSRFKVTLPLNLDPLTSYTFVLKSIDNPEQPVCNMDRLMIIVTDQTQAAAASRTAPNVWNVPSITFLADASLRTLDWADVNGNTLSSISLSIGIYSQVIRIIPPTGENFNDQITFSSSDTTVTILSSSLIANRGSPYLSLRVAAPITAVPQIILFRFSKEETSSQNVYSELPKLQLILTNTKTTLPVYRVRIAKGGTSLPYQWNLASLNLIPQSELKIEASIVSPTLSALTVVGASSLSFGPTQTLQGFVFDLASTADPLAPPSFVLSVSGDDSPNYQFKTTTIVVEVLTPPAAAPVLSDLTIAAYSPTQETFSFNIDQMASVFWHVAYKDEIITDCLRVRAKYNEGFTYDSTSAIQAQYGVFYVYNETIKNSYQITNLLSNRVYSYILCPSNQLDVMGGSAQGTFTTQDNNASPYQIILKFSQSITQSQLTSLVCLFNTELQLPNLK